jgi:hypothetical protein
VLLIIEGNELTGRITKGCSQCSYYADEQSLDRWVIGSPNLFTIDIWFSVNKAQKLTLVNEVGVSNPKWKEKQNHVTPPCADYHPTFSRCGTGWRMIVVIKS